jgi:hydrogenase nickel incorporation protein HypA/HybF
VHELSIALEIVDVAAAAAQRAGGGRIDVVHVRLGALAGVIREALHAAYPLACAGTPLAGSTLQIEEVPVAVACQPCGATRPVRSVQELCCAACGTPATEIVDGQDIEVVTLEVSDGEPAAAG